MTRRTRLGIVAVTAAVVALMLSMATGAPSVAAQTSGDPEEGAEVYRSSCAMCHGGEATGMMGMHPALRGAVERLTREGVEVTIRKGRSTQPPMPAFENRLSDGEINDVIAYIETLPDGPRNFGPGDEGGMGRGMMDRMMDGGSAWLAALVIILVAALAAIVGYLIGVSRARRS